MVAVVTGAGSGIGRAVSLALAERGYRLALLDIAVEAAAETAALAEGDAAVLECDVADRDRVAEAFAAIDARFGRVDVLVNSVMVSVPRAHPEDLALADWQRTLD